MTPGNVGTERAWWLVASISALATLLNLATGHFGDALNSAIVGALVVNIILGHREIRRLRARPKSTEYFVIRPPS